MKNKLIILLSATVLFFTWSCKDYLDVNHDPDTMESIPDAKVLLPAAQLGIANNLMGWDFGFGGGYWVQYWTQAYTASQFKVLCEYLPRDFNTAYTSLMREPMPDLKRIKTMTENDENPSLYYIAEALSIFTWQIITDVWGNMPYTEALRGDEGLYHPKQDTQESIYTDLLKRVDALLEIDLMDPSVDDYYTVDERYDFIFEGDMLLWDCFVRALKMKLLLRLSETPGFDINAVYEYVYESEWAYGANFGYPYNELALVIAADEGGAKISGKVWDDSMDGKRHPMREFQAGGANYFSTNVIGCKSFVDYLRVNKDPRLATLFDGTKGAFFGDFDSKADSEGGGTTDDKQDWCTVNYDSFKDLFLMSPWEIYFNMAEVAARADDPYDAQEYYEEAVIESLLQHGIKDDDIIDDGGYAEWQDGTVEECIEQIAMQRWIANCNYQHIEAFLERNRTKYPAVDDIDIKADRRKAWDEFPVGMLTISVNGRALLNGNLPASPLYPDNYIMRNNNAPSQKANVGEKVWWNQKAGK